ncbi:uncharacterized protein LOC126970793 isoform X1 [Leptidea sinapis]|uniref:uncharacterized protein LOC126970793 isoform X1 n=1 Tax=Leptidea sinapis TaxID=189913 RepID=UPI002132FC5E|nr:uncharacterized protein LOC126970793 isoform X1 [Leptidea sinapis]
MVDQNINKDIMIDSDLIDVESLDFPDDQTWLLKSPNDSGQRVDIVDFNLSCDWPIKEDEEYLKSEKKLLECLDIIINQQPNEVALPDKHKFDSRTFVRPKKRVQRPSIHNIMEANSPMTFNQTPSHTNNKYLTYNKYSCPLGPVNPMLRLKTFNVDTNSDNSHVVKEYAVKRRTVMPDDDPQLDGTICDSERTSVPSPFKAIQIDYSQPAHNIHNTFNKGFSNIMNERGSLTMYQSGESLMRMSPPSLVSSIVMDNSFTVNSDSIDGKKSLQSNKDIATPNVGRDSKDPMMTSMTLSILDEKDMNTSFLSQTTYPDHDSLLDSLPPSLVNSINSQVSSTHKTKNDNRDTNIFSSATFTHLDQSEKLLSARPRIQMFNTYKRDSIKSSESYTKAREESCQIDTGKVLNENRDNVDSKESPKRVSNEMSETVTLHYSNNKFRRSKDAEKENVNSTFETDNAFFNEMDIERAVEVNKKESLNITMDKQELNEIIQARQKLSIARKALPNETVTMVNQDNDIKTIHLPNQTITVPKQSMENASELLSRRRTVTKLDGTVTKLDEPQREAPKRTATFRKMSPRANTMDATVVYVQPEENFIDINSATMNLIDTEKFQDREWGREDRAMVGSNESTDTGTFSSSSPPEFISDSNDPRSDVASTPLLSIQKLSRNDLLHLHNTISPIYDIVDEKSYTVTTAASNGLDNNTTIINTATISKKSAKRDILAGTTSPEKKMNQIKAPTKITPSISGTTVTMGVPTAMPRKTSLPTSKLRQYSSHRELHRIPAHAPRGLPPGRSMVRRPVYSSNPALSPTAPGTAPLGVQPARRGSVVVTHREDNGEIKVDKLSKPAMTAPPALVRQGTETLRKERPQSQLVQPRDLRISSAGASGVAVAMRTHYGGACPPTSRPSSVCVPRSIVRPASGPLQRQATVPQVESQRSAPPAESRVSALPRPSRLPAPRRTVRQSMYSVAPGADADHY